ncbi:MAG TPA: ABC transporter substrate-binding protein [Candidatus Dormibacteraeota bacterium]|jgi:osmoprotectant transport system substrate-binding protein|nr:ABC transporter substrate-binding protein [Candidatus Dormibacteraeota bacterium]
MNRFRGAYLLVAALAALATVAAACGSTNTPAPASKGTLTVAGFNFPESSILANLYGEALAHDGYTVNYKLNLGTRKVIAPALQSGQIDLYPGYAASELEYYNNSAGEATADPAATTAKLNTYLSKINAIALTPSAAFDGNAYAVTKATATKYNLTKLSDLTPIAGQLVFGAGPECPTYKFCLPGLMSVYGLHFKQTLTLDTDGPATRAAFKNGSIQVGLVFSSDADLNALGLVVLQDDMHMIAADNVVPVIRTAVDTDEVKNVLNKVDAGLTTADLVTMNSQVELLHQDADAVATAYLQQHNYFS